MISSVTREAALSRPRPIVVAAAVFCIALVASAALIWRMEQQRLQVARSGVSSLAGSHAHALQISIERALSAAYSLAALVRQGNGTVTDFNSTATRMLPFYPGASALELAPGGVISAAVPLAENQKAIGFDLLKDPVQKKEALMARDTGKLTLAGPLNLYQGGFGAVGRLPVFLEDRKGESYFWGFTIVVLRFPEALAPARLTQLLAQGYHYELWRLHPETGRRQVIAASSSAPLPEPVDHHLELPNGVWSLSVAPAGGWGDAQGLMTKICLGLLFSLVLASVARLLIELKDHKQGLEAVVAQRTAELEQDITNRRLTEKALLASEEKYRSLFEESQDMIFISTYDGRHLDMNPAGVSRLGYSSKEELLRVAVKDIYLYPEHRAYFLDCLERDGYIYDFETQLRRRDGRELHVSITATTIRDDTGNPFLVRGIIRDISEHRKLEEQLRQSQKMESIGTLAGGVAHDFNNILTAITGYGYLALMKMEPENPHRQSIENMLTAADRAAYLTQGLLTFSRTQMSNKKRIDLNELMLKAEGLLRRLIGEDIEFLTSLYKSPVMVSADPNQFEQVLMNLATNARDAMPRGGRLAVAAGLTQLDEVTARRLGDGKPGAYGTLSVSDSGSGMTEEIRQRIFEPFFTTKEVGKGTGLGLAIIYGIVKQHDGFIEVSSEPGKGTTFIIYLPADGSGEREQKEAQEEASPARGTETILLAEDDETLRTLTKTVLEEFGYEVITAVDGEDAVTKFAENKDRLHLLLTDLIMPKKSGKEVYDQVRQLRPGIKVIFVSGYSPDIVRDRASFEKEATIVYKPISPRELLKKVRSVLDEGSPRE